MTDAFSWDPDSDPFEEDDSWMSEHESVCNNWRGWKKTSSNGAGSGSGSGGAGSAGSSNQLPNSINNILAMVEPFQKSGSNNPATTSGIVKSLQDGTVPSLTEIAARVVACHIPFEVVERVYPPVPEQLQLRIAFWSFPDNEEDIRLYSCLANGSADEFQKGETLYRYRTVQNILQIGFHLSATLISPTIKKCTVAVTFDRGRITSCTCTCTCASSWCSHVVAVCLHRIYKPNTVCLRAPVSESLSRLSRDQLQKFAQYLISELPQQILPTAQRLLDDLLLNDNSDINKVCGAPDPTAGASVNEQTKWCLDESRLHENIRKIVIKLCIPSPIVYSDVNYLSSAAPPAAAEWTSLLRPLRGREPEGLWNLLSIVREMLRRHDRNAIPLLKILTEEILACDQILLWWFDTNVSLHRGYPLSSYNSNGNGGQQQNNNRSNMHSNIYASQHACCSLCDEIVILWRLVTLNPVLSRTDTCFLFEQLCDWHVKTLSIVVKFKPSTVHAHQNNSTSASSNLVNGKTPDIEIFSGFKPAMVSCLIDWNSYPIQGVTNQSKNRYSFYSNSINAQRSPSCHHVISGTLVKITPNMSWKSLYNKTALSNYKRNKNNIHGKSHKRKVNFFSIEDGEQEESKDEDKLNDSNDNSEDSGMNNQEFWERAFFSSDEDNHDNENIFKLLNINEQNIDANDDNIDVGDDYQIYVYNTHNDSNKIKNPNSLLEQNSQVSRSEDPVLFAASQIKPIEDSFEILFSRAEALYAHGYVNEACQLSVQLAEELLRNPPALQLSNSIEQQTTQPPQPQSSGRNHSKRANRNRFNPALHQVSLLASATLSKAAFLCQVLSENEDSHLLAFHVGIFGLELVRPPASTKVLEVKLTNQEQELVNSLKKIPLCSRALSSLREKAEQLRDGRLTTRGEALLPLTLASYIFDALVLSNSSSSMSNSIPTSLSPTALRLPSDERLGFEASVSAIGLKANVSEAEHPLLCEGTRRQRGDLGLTLLVHYKDNKERLNKIMDKLLDKEIHQIHRKPSAAYITNNHEVSNENSQASKKNNSNDNQSAPSTSKGNVEQICSEPTEMKVSTPLSTAKETNSNSEVPTTVDPKPSTSANNDKGCSSKAAVNKSQSDNLNWDEDYKIWEAKFRRMNLNNENEKKHSIGMVSIDSSAPETTSSDNSPTVSRRNLYISNKVSGSESSSSGESSDSFSSTSSVDKKTINVNNIKEGEASNSDSNQAPLFQIPNDKSAKVQPTSHNRSLANRTPLSNSPSSSILMPSSSNGFGTSNVPNRMNLNKSNQFSNNGGLSSFKPIRYKGKRGHYPMIPNQPSEASAHFMFELAKTVLAKAGGNNTSVLFTQPPSSQNCRAPHRNLHMCAFQIGLYALGLHNAVSPNWLSRTYSSHVSWITAQAMEIGHQAISFLIDTWEGHLTPPEVASLADRASRAQEPLMVQAAAQLALSCLPQAHALTPNEIQRALIQCKEQNNEMLERACLAVETSAQGGGVYPEVLFGVARKWFELYENEKLVEITSNSGDSSSNRRFSDQAVIDILPSNDLGSNNDSNRAIAEPSSDRQFSDFMYMNDSFNNSSQYEDEFSSSSGIDASTGSNIVINSSAPMPNAPNSVQLYQGNMFPQSYPYSSQPPFNPYQGIRYYSNGTYQNSYPANLQMVPTTNPRYSNFMHYAYLTLPNMGPALKMDGQPQQPLLSFSPYSPNFYHQPSGKQPIAPYYMAQQGTASAMMRPQYFPMPHNYSSQASNQQTTNGSSFFPLLANPAFPYINYPGSIINRNPNSHNQVASSSNQAIQGPRQLGYMHAAYRVGMLAMETLARRVHDDRPQAKYSPNPSYGEDVKWLLCIAKQLGSSYVQEFCMCTVNAVASPFVLYDIVIDAAQSLAHTPSNNSPYIQTIRSQILTPLIQKCQQMFAACIYFQILHITSSDYEEFLSTIRAARAAFHLTPGGNIHFNELLQSLKRTKTCKKELWQHITNAMQST